MITPLTLPRASPSRSTRRARSPAPASATFNVGQAGTFTVTTTGVPTCRLSETGALPSGLTFTDNGDGTATLAGTPPAGSGGTYPFTITATNGVSPAATQSFTLTVHQAITCTITSSASTTFTVGQVGTFTVTTSGCAPLHIVRDGRTAVGESRSRTTGTARRHFREHRLRAPAEHTRSRSPPRTVSVRLPPRASSSRSTRRAEITSPAATTFTVGQAGTFTVTSTGWPTCTLSADGRTAVVAVTFGRQRGRHGDILGNTDLRARGTYPVTITATNGVGPDATQTFTLTVNQACKITSADHATFAVGQAGTFTVKSTGLPTCTCPPAACRARSRNLPSGVTFTRQRGRHGDNLGNTGCGHRRYVPAQDHRHERCRS